MTADLSADLADFPEPREPLDDAEEFALPESEEEREAFRVDGERKFLWAMKILHQKAEVTAAKKAWAEEEKARLDAVKARLDAWLAEDTARDEKDAAWLKASVEAYAQAERERTGGRRKTLYSPYGTAGTTERKPAYFIEDADQLVSWAVDERPEWVTEKKTYTVALAAVKRGLDLSAGEVVPGVGIRPGGVTASVDIDLNGDEK